MKLVILFALLTGITNPEPRQDVQSRKVDTKTSTIAWKGYKVTGEHNGNVLIKAGEVQMDGNVITGGTFTIDMNSITCNDLQGEMNGKLVGHLKSDDFFGVATYPNATLKITRAIPQNTAGDYKMLGDLTIKGKTKPVKFFAKVRQEGGQQIATADIKVDRSEYDVRYGSGSFFDNLGDKTIYDEFDLSVRLVLN
ncbi:MAG: YceI family protein [Saprospiraceae bacterium]|nr:YceI family protein [Saprospiraceae bacterium]